MLGLMALAVLAGWGLGLIRFGQTLPGRITDHYATYDGWELACDTAMDGTDPRCYVQYVDVYRPRPDFAAAMVEVVMRKDAQGRPDPHVRFDIEPGLDLSDGGLSVVTASGAAPVDLSGCSGHSCVVSGDAGRALLRAWRDGESLRFEIAEDRDAPRVLSWPLAPMGRMLDDFAALRREHGLP